MTPRFLDAGETALVVEFADRIDPAARDAVIALDAALRDHPLDGIAETVPTYRSLMIHYDPLRLQRAALCEHATRLIEAGSGTAPVAGVHWTLPACYDPELGEDLAELSATLGLGIADIARLHAGAEYRIAMIGFAPGWAYLDGLPEALNLPRRGSPRPRIPDNSLIIAGGLAIIVTMAMPSGWHIIGRTAENLFAPRQDPPFLCAPGDRIRFEAVDLATHLGLARRAAEGEIIARRTPQ